MKQYIESRLILDAHVGKRKLNVIGKMFLTLVILTLAGGISELNGLFPFSETFHLAFVDLLITFSLSLAALFAYVKYVEKRPIVSLGFYKEEYVKQYLVGFGTGFVMLAVTLLISIVFGANKLTLADSYTGIIGFFLLFLVGFIVQGGAEEIFFRGWLLPSFTKKYNVYVGIVVTSLFFTFLHGLNPGITMLPLINLTLFAVFAAVYALHAKNIWGIMGWHSAWNFTQGNIFGIEVSGNQISGGTLFATTALEGKDLLSGGAFGIEGSIITTLVLLLATLYFIRKMKLGK